MHKPCPWQLSFPIPGPKPTLRASQCPFSLRLGRFCVDQDNSRFVSWLCLIIKMSKLAPLLCVSNLILSLILICFTLYVCICCVKAIISI